MKVEVTSSVHCRFFFHSKWLSGRLALKHSCKGLDLHAAHRSILPGSRTFGFLSAVGHLAMIEVLVSKFQSKVCFQFTTHDQNI